MPVGSRSRGVCPPATIGSVAIELLRWRKWKGHTESRSFGGATGYIDLTLHGIHKMADNLEANTEAALITPGHRAFEGAEDTGLVFVRDADAVIPNGQSCLGAMTNQRDLDRLASAIFDGVRQEVIGDLFDGQCIEQSGHLAFDARF